MVKCSGCGRELAKAEKKIETSLFRIELFTCDNCGLKFKVVT